MRVWKKMKKRAMPYSSLTFTITIYLTHSHLLLPFNLTNTLTLHSLNNSPGLLLSPRSTLNAFFLHPFKKIYAFFLLPLFLCSFLPFFLFSFFQPLFFINHAKLIIFYFLTAFAYTFFMLCHVQSFTVRFIRTLPRC